MKKTNAIIISGMLLLGIQASASPIVLFEESFEGFAPGYEFDGTTSPFIMVMPGATAETVTAKVTEESIALLGDNTYRMWRSRNLGTGGSMELRTDVDFRLNDSASIYTAQSWLYMGSSAPFGEGVSNQVSSVFGAWMKNVSNETMASVFFRTQRQNASPILEYFDGAVVKNIDLHGDEAAFAFSADTWYGVSITVNEIDQRYSFEILDTDSVVLYSATNLELQNPGQFNHYGIYNAARHGTGSNDGYDNRVDGISISVIPEPSSYAFMFASLVAGFVIYSKKRKK